MPISEDRLLAAENAELKELGDVPIDDVLGIIDRQTPDYRALYYRWERQQWAAGAIDFSEDRKHWDETFSDLERRAALAAILATAKASRDDGARTCRCWASRLGRPRFLSRTGPASLA